MSVDGFGGGLVPGVVESLRAWVWEDFAVDLGEIEGVGHGGDEAAQLWRGVSADGVSYAVKLSGGGTPAGLIVSAHLAEHGVPGVTAPVPTRHGRLWSEREGRRLSVVPWVSDDRALSGGMSAGHWTSYGALLAKVHDTAVTDELARILPREDHTHERVASAARALDSRLHRPADDPTGVGGLTDELARALAEE
ncbi:MAG: hypothetical protein ACRDWI_16305 [Jiangellaceae bacterium]